MRNAKTSTARLISGLIVLGACGGAAAAPLDGYWELRVENADAPAGCRVETDAIVVLSQGPDGLAGRLGRHFYRDVEIAGTAVGARSIAGWAGADVSAAVIAELNAKRLPQRFTGTIADAGDEIVGEDIFYCANHSGDVLNSVTEHTASTTMKRLDLAIRFVQQIDGAWQAVSIVDYDQPFRVEVRAARELARPQYPVTLAFRVEATNAASRATVGIAKTTMARVAGAEPLYRSAPIRFVRLAPGAVAAAGERDGGPVVSLAPGAKLYAAPGDRVVYAFAAQVRAGRFPYLEIGLTAAAAALVLGGLGIGAMKVVPMAAAGLGLMRRVPVPNSPEPAAPDADEPAEPEAEPAFRTRAHRDTGTQEIAGLAAASPPAIRFRASAGPARTALRVAPAA